jgi:hypothetical protein
MRQLTSLDAQFLGGLDFGIVADRDLADDPWSLAEAVRCAQDELLALVPTRGAVPMPA